MHQSPKKKQSFFYNRVPINHDSRPMSHCRAYVCGVESIAIGPALNYKLSLGTASQAAVYMYNVKIPGRGSPWKAKTSSP